MAKYTVYPKGCPYAANMALPEEYAREVAGEGFALQKDNEHWLQYYKKPRDVLATFDVYDLHGYVDHQKLFVDMYRSASRVKGVDWLLSCALAEIEHANARIAELEASPRAA